MNFDALWEVFTKLLWPVILMYAGYLHNQLSKLMARFDALQEQQFKFEVTAAKEFVTHSTVSALEDKITRKLDRIDDKVTKILESRNNA